MRISILMVLMLIMQLVFSQNQDYTKFWYFGKNAGLDFSVQPPAIITTGALSTLEGVASISDTLGLGHLLFYTDGVTVWNKNNLIMQNGGGLHGNSSSTQSAIIIPQPSVDSLFYIFTTSKAGDSINYGLSYSIVNITKNGGLGAVDPIKKNISLLTAIQKTEKITAVKASNDTTWIITHLWNSNQFNSYALTKKGLNPIPVISKVGMVITGNYNGQAGYLKASHDAKHIAMATYTQNKVQLFNFSTRTGQVTYDNRCFIDNLPLSYGVEFSNDNSKLYFTTINDTNKVAVASHIVQYDICAKDSLQILASKNIVHTTPDTLGALQLANNTAIYYAKFNKSELGVILTPDEAGAACNPSSPPQSLGGKICQYGLPNFIQSDISLSPSFSGAPACVGADFFFQTFNLFKNDSITWDYGDNSFGNKLIHVFSSPGTIIVKMIIHRCYTTDTISGKITIKPAKELSIDGKSTVCVGTTEILTVHTPADVLVSNYLWDNGETTASVSRKLDKNETYKITITPNGSYECLQLTAGINVKVVDPPTVNLGADYMLCKGEHSLDATCDGCTYKWSNGSTDPIIALEASGWDQKYSVTVNNGACSADGMINIWRCIIKEIGIPNAFSPNNDGANEVLYVYGTGISEMHLLIFDRFGQIVFESTKQDIGWDGTFKGKKCEMDVYVYYLTAKFYRGDDATLKGNITLLR